MSSFYETGLCKYLGSVSRVKNKVGNILVRRMREQRKCRRDAEGLGCPMEAAHAWPAGFAGLSNCFAAAEALRRRCSCRGRRRLPDRVGSRRLSGRPGREMPW